jgi:hypothetical protein
MVSLAQSALAEAWALRHLAERYNEAAQTNLSSASLLLLEAMIRDHVTDLKVDTNRMQGLLRPVLASGGVNSMDNSARDSVAINEPDWRSAVLDLFKTTQAADDLVRGLFAGADAPQSGVAAVIDNGTTIKGLSDLWQGFLRSQLISDVLVAQELHTGPRR